MASLIDSLRSVARRIAGGLSHASNQIAEGVSRSVASFGERLDRHALQVRQERGWTPATGHGRDRRHLTGERAMSVMMRGAGGIGWPGANLADRSRQVLYFRRWVYVACDRICSKIAATPWRVGRVHQAGEHADWQIQKSYRGFDLICKSYAARLKRYQKSLHSIKPHEEVEEVGPDHPLCKLLAHPNAWDKSPGQLWYELVLFLLLTGNAYLWVVPDRAFGMPLELWVIPSQWVFGPYLSAAGPKFYRIQPYVGGAGSFDIPADEIIHFQCKSPLSKIDGFAPLQAGAEWVDVAESIDQSRYFEFKNGTQVRGSIEFDPNYQDPEDTDIDAIGAKFLARYQGERNAGVPLILPPGAKMVPLNIAPADMSWEGGFEQMRDAVLALFAVPKEVAGIVDAGSHTAMWGPLAQFCEHAIAPKLRLIGEILTETLCRRWDDALRMWADDPTPHDPVQENAQIQQDIANGVISHNEARSMRGLEPIEDPMADELLVAPNLIPLSKLGEQIEQQNKQKELEAQAKIEQAKNPPLPPGHLGQPGQESNNPASRNGRPKDEDESWLPPQRPLPWDSGGGNKPPAWGKSYSNGNGHVATLARPLVSKALSAEPQLIDLEDIRQPDDFSCGACAAMTVGRYYGVGPKSLSEWKKALGTNIQTSTTPDAIVDYLTKLGLQVEARQEMTLGQLRDCWSRGIPVICFIQEYGHSEAKVAKRTYGHIVAVVGVALGQVIVQDSSIDSLLEGEASDHTRGRMMIDENKWMEVWHDQNAATGEKLVRFGIAVGPPIVPASPARRVRKSAPDGRITRDDFGFVSPPEGLYIPSYGQCETCHKWTGKSCLEFSASEEIPADGACDLYVYGEPVGEAGIGQESGGTTPDEAGYVERQVRCENCARSNEDATECLFYAELNRQNPKRFSLDVVIPVPQSCCNAQQAKKSK